MPPRSGMTVCTEPLPKLVTPTSSARLRSCRAPATISAAEAEHLRIRSELLAKLQAVIAARELKQAEAAEARAQDRHHRGEADERDRRAGRGQCERLVEHEVGIGMVLAPDRMRDERDRAERGAERQREEQFRKIPDSARLKEYMDTELVTAILCGGQRPPAQ